MIDQISGQNVGDLGGKGLGRMGSSVLTVCCFCMCSKNVFWISFTCIFNTFFCMAYLLTIHKMRLT